MVEWNCDEVIYWRDFSRKQTSEERSYFSRNLLLTTVHHRHCDLQVVRWRQYKWLCGESYVGLGQHVELDLLAGIFQIIELTQYLSIFIFTLLPENFRHTCSC